jgi:hypothetical protein
MVDERSPRPLPLLSTAVLLEADKDVGPVAATVVFVVDGVVGMGLGRWSRSSWKRPVMEMLAGSDRASTGTVQPGVRLLSLAGSKMMR